MSGPTTWEGRSSTLFACVSVFVSSLVFWRLRIVERGTNPAIEVGPIDLYVEHMPMAQYAYEELSQGRMPLWNPFQFFGQPFLAVPHVGLFYPLHLFSLFVDAIPSVEISFVMHMCLGGIGMWLLTRRFGFTKLASSASTITFMWSGHLVFNNVVPGIFACMNWLPLTILLIDCALARVRFAHTTLIAAVTSQFLLGASEVLVHTLYVGAAFTLFRLAAMRKTEPIMVVAASGLGILACIAAAFLLATPQLLPSFEFIAESARGTERLTFEEAVFFGIEPLEFLRMTLATNGIVAIGVLPILAIPLALGTRVHRFVWIFALALAGVSAILVASETAYRLYYSIPFIGSLFRRPTKFLDIYAFGQALVAGLVLARLQDLVEWSRLALWRDAGWLACLAIVGATLAWTSLSGESASMYWLASLALLVTFGGISQRHWRNRILAALLVVQMASLFFQVGGTHVRPIERPEIYHTHDRLLESLRDLAGPDRIYLSPNFFIVPGLTAKQGVLSRTKIASDYEPLLSTRSKRFFNALSPTSVHGLNELPPGMYYLQRDTNWTLVDLMATRFFVVSPDEAAARFMRRRPSEFRLIEVQDQVQVFERLNTLPRAHVVSEARHLSGPGEALAAIQNPRFDPRKQVVLETPASDRFLEVDANPDENTKARVKIVRDEAEEVVVSVSTSRRGLLVLSDLFYPGWRAWAGGQEVEIHRANYLFRAVEVEAGQTEVRFVYEPESFWYGWVVAGCTLALLVGASSWHRRRNSAPSSISV
jgi:hypothetical protein